MDDRARARFRRDDPAPVVDRATTRAIERIETGRQSPATSGDSETEVRLSVATSAFAMRTTSLCRLATRGAFAFGIGIVPIASAGELVQLDPFARAADGYRGCRETAPPLLTIEQSRIVAHERVERGTRCAMEGSCEPGGAYRRDPEINERVRAAIAADTKFADASLWVSTTRKFVTVTGCVRSAAQRRALDALIGAQPHVDRVLDETRVGTAATDRNSTAPK